MGKVKLFGSSLEDASIFELELSNIAQNESLSLFFAFICCEYSVYLLYWNRKKAAPKRAALEFEGKEPTIQWLI